MSEVNLPTNAVPLTGAEQVKQKIADLQLRLQTAAPGYDGLLHEIHKALTADENVVTLLSDEEVGIICAGLSKKKNIVLVEASKDKKTGMTSNSKLKTMLDDL